MLSKSDLQSFLQCSRRLWLEHYHPERAVEDSNARRREIDGNLVGTKAREALGEDIIWPQHRDNHEEATQEARRLLESAEHVPAVEVPMLHNAVFARADALIPEETAYALRETKASTFPLKTDKVTPKAPKDHHINDVTIQAWVMRGAGYPLRRAELNYLDKHWRYPGGGDYSGLFRTMDVTDAVEQRLDQVEVWRDEAHESLDGDMPDTTTGRHCTDPNPCPFHEFCRSIDPPDVEHPIELLPDSAGKSLARKLKDQKGYESILDPDPEELTGKQAALYRRIQRVHRTGEPVLEAGSDDRIAAFSYPRYFFDFEGIDLAVPVWPGVRPFEQVPFQWSCHIECEPGAFEHAEFLDLSGEDPSLPCIERMREVIDPNDDGPIFVYSATYERSVLRYLAERHPDHSDLLERYIERLQDLLPIVREYFYHPVMKGSFSIKKVLPIVASDLDYGSLDQVQDGTAAQIAYLDAAFGDSLTAEARDALETNMRLYCRQDTWAMVEIAYFLAREGRPIRPAEA